MSYLVLLALSLLPRSSASSGSETTLGTEGQLVVSAGALSLAGLALLGFHAGLLLFLLILRKRQEIKTILKK